MNYESYQPQLFFNTHLLYLFIKTAGNHLLLYILKREKNPLKVSLIFSGKHIPKMRLFVLLTLFISCSLAYDIFEKDVMVRDDCTTGDSCDACGTLSTYTEEINNDKRKITGS